MTWEVGKIRVALIEIMRIITLQTVDNKINCILVLWDRSSSTKIAEIE
jgi:hypothetical protein